MEHPVSQQSQQEIKLLTPRPEILTGKLEQPFTLATDVQVAVL
jgi:hypothetical protein